jgi:hypothetical protein
VADLADTCTAALAFLRAGSTPQAGPYADNLNKAVGFVCDQVERSDQGSLYVTDVIGTRLQQKLGTYIDTFLAALLLAEVKDRMPDDAATARVAAALDKVLHKIERNQQSDGSWANVGWAPALTQAMAGKAINRAVQAGAEVDDNVLKKAEEHGRGQFDERQGGFRAERAANIDLYAAAAAVSAMQDSDNTNKVQQEAILYGRPLTPMDAAGRELELKRIDDNEKELRQAKDVIEEKLKDRRFVAGFGSNGGEEFLSYMMLGESLVVDGGKAWQEWDSSMTANLNRIQNEDGSWTGHHCITGRTFCTASALLVLTVDRAPVPLAAKIRKR